MHFRLTRAENTFCVMKITQNEHRSPPATVIPALLKNSTLWSMSHQRLMTEAEQFQVQGWPVFVEANHPYPCPFKQMLVEPHEYGDFRAKSFPQMRAMAGNGMNMMCIGFLLAFILACSETSDSNASGSSPYSSEGESSAVDDTDVEEFIEVPHVDSPTLEMGATTPPS